mmetsp:Transcript_27169/g.32951  ORF Transcript_27169/g.32951 Transcript_27169/m.32951 type:complete len:203 (-) Transcript_27169:52-660(-)
MLTEAWIHKTNVISDMLQPAYIHNSKNCHNVQYFTLDIFLLILVLGCLLYSPKPSSSSRTNQTNLSTCWSLLAHCTGFTNVLMVTTTVRMLYWILRHTPNLWPTIPLHSKLVVCTPCLQQRLISPTTTSYNTNLRTNIVWNCLLTTTGKTKPRCPLILVMCHHNGKTTRTTRKRTTIPNLRLHITNDCTLWHHIQWHHITHS